MGWARENIPTLKYGNKIGPEDIAGMVGQPVVGKIFYVDATNGSDSDDGGTWSSAFKTLTKAEDMCTSYNYDVIVIAPSGNSATAEVSSITWDKSYITVIGATPPNHYGMRARVGFSSTVVSPCITLTGVGNRFINLQLVTTEDINVLLYINGLTRSYFSNVHFLGIGNNTTGDDTAARCVVLNESSENYFGDCTFGTSGSARSEANALLEQIGATRCARNKYERCLFTTYNDASTPEFVRMNGGYSSEDYTWFKDCVFSNSIGSSTTMDVGFNMVSGTGNGDVMIDGCAISGVTEWSSNHTDFRGFNMPDVTAANGGFMETLS